MTIRSACFLIAVSICLTSCMAPDTHHQVIISIPEQRMALLEDGASIASYPVSTSKYGTADFPGSYGTPLGDLEIADKIGGSAPSGTVFKDRRRTGEIVSEDSPGRETPTRMVATSTFMARRKSETSACR